MTVHERPVGASVEWYTPPDLFVALGIRFDLDPASPEEGPVPWVPARRFIAPSEDGLEQPWRGNVWLNPPYGPVGQRFIARMVEHGDGVLLVAARTETRAFQAAAEASDAVVFLRDRLHFIRPDGSSGRSSFASALLAFGSRNAQRVRGADLGWTA